MGMRRFAHKAADAALELLYPTRCVGCEMPGELLCDECRADLPWIEQRRACPVCGAAFGDVTCTLAMGLAVGMAGLTAVVVWWLAMGLLGLAWMALWLRFDPQRRSDHAGKVPFAPAIVCAAVVAVIATTLL